jgi:general L-amino acid transport system substrate-binding protein
MYKQLAATLIITLIAPGLSDASANTLEKIKSRGSVVCGTSQGQPGFSQKSADGKWTGFDIDICRALSAAIFNDPEKVQYKPLTSLDRMVALGAGEVDVLPRTTTWSLGRDVGQGIIAVAVNYYDGQGFLVPKELQVASASDIKDATICTPQGTTSEQNIADYFNSKQVKFQTLTFKSPDEAIQAYLANRCDVYSTDMSSLASNLLKMPNPDEQIILPDIISKEPLAIWVRQGDDQWLNLVRWTFYAMVQAEEYGITSQNIDTFRQTQRAEIARFLGADGSLGEKLGLTNDWALNVIKNVGNYGESFNRHLGPNSPLKLPRGVNALWKDGGLQYSPPFR